MSGRSEITQAESTPSESTVASDETTQERYVLVRSCCSLDGGGTAAGFGGCRPRKEQTVYSMKVASIFLLSLVFGSAEWAADVEVFATGLNNPRGLKFGPDGNLYVAEGGTGGTASTVGLCTQVPFPVGPYSGGFTSRISRIDRLGNRHTVVDRLPSSQTGPALGGLVSGVADIAFLNGVLYGLEAGAGCSHGLAGTANMIFRVNENGTTTAVANLSAFQQANPVAHPDPDDFEPDGTWYSFIELRGNFYAVEPNHGELDEISPWGTIRRVIDISASQGHVVPTAVTYHGNFYIGNLQLFPIVPGSSHIYKVTPSGEIRIDTSNLTTVLGVVFDGRDRMYVLEMSPAGGFPMPFIGRVRRFEPSGTSKVIAGGLALPTAITLGPDGRLYVSNFGFGFPAGAGQIVRITPEE